VTPAQRRLVAAIRAAGDGAEYWPIVNDWLREVGADAGRAQSLALRNINRTVAALLKAGVITIGEDDGCFHLAENNRK
jgi:hypothetical protein